VDWKEYRRLLEMKIADALYNYEFAKKKSDEAKAKYEAVLLEKESFEKALDEIVGEKTQE
jgi:hypothetical protein